MKRILIIEDNEDILEATVEILELNGYKIETANNGQKGFELAKVILPDLIISDVKMPKMNGYELLNKLRENTSTALIPLIFLSALTQKTDIQKGERSQAFCYLTKPFTIIDLLKSVKGILKVSAQSSTITVIS